MDDLLTLAGLVVGVVAASFAVLTVVGVVVLARRARRGRSARPGGSAALPGRAAAGAQLLRADEAVRDAEVDLQFALAQFGEERTAGFRRAIESARAELRRAFELQQRLDDPAGAGEHRRRQWTRDVAAIATRVQRDLDAEMRRFADRRDVEAGAADEIATSRARLDGIRRMRDAAAGALARLRAAYAAALLEPVADNLDHADAALADAQSRLDAAAEALAAPGASAVGDALARVRERLAEAEALLAAIAHRAAELADADAAVDRVRADADRAADDARALRDAPPDPDAGASVGAAIAEVEAVVAAAPRSGSGPRDPLRHLDALVAATDALDVAVAAARNQQRRLDGARSALDGALVSARTQIAAVADYVAGRRGGVGVDARTRLAEAERQLVLAENAADPVEALDAARRAQTLARDADALARYRG